MGGLEMVHKDKDGKVLAEIKWERQVIYLDGKPAGADFKEKKVKK